MTNEPCHPHPQDDQYNREKQIRPGGSVQQRREVYDVLKRITVTDGIEKNNNALSIHKSTDCMVPLNGKAFFRGSLKIMDDELSSMDGDVLDDVEGILPPLLAGYNLQNEAVKRGIWCAVEEGGSKKKKKKLWCLEREEALELFASMEGGIDKVGNVRNDSCNNDMMPMPMMEIRESYDEHGRRIESECSNVHSRLNALSNLHDGIADSSGLHDYVKTDADTCLSDDFHHDEQKKKNIDYGAISKRLDELILLEENEESLTKNKSKVNKLRGRSNKKSSSPYSSGWNRGFLNGSTSKKSNNTRRPENGNKNSNAEIPSVPKESTLPNYNSKKNIPENVRLPEDGNKTSIAETSKVTKESASPIYNIKKNIRKPANVTIHLSNNEVIPIPRIGTQSVKALKEAEQQQRRQEQHRPQAKLVSRRSNNKSSSSTSRLRSRTFEPNVMSNHVMERPITSNSVESKSLQRSVIDKVPESFSNNDHAKPKKLSKFAQRRLEMRQESG